MKSGAGDNIKRLREAHGMTQDEIGAIAGVSGKAVSTWEQGKKEPRMGALSRIAQHFNVRVSDIIDDDDITQKTTSYTSGGVIEEKWDTLFSLIRKASPDQREAVYNSVLFALKSVGMCQEGDVNENARKD